MLKYGQIAFQCNGHGLLKAIYEYVGGLWVSQAKALLEIGWKVFIFDEE